jgi:hypothetical protein
MYPFLKAKFRNPDFVDRMISRFGVVYVSAQISYWNRMTISALGYWKM